MAEKEFKTIDEQIEILKGRGLSIEDEIVARDFLLRNNYYRISGYSLTLRSNDVFHPGTSFRNIQDIYEFDHVREGYVVPDKVIAYLKTTKPYLVRLGMYKHPFKEDVTLLGPYWYQDGTYSWDRDTWKYVVKYRLELPQEFIDHVMSEEGTQFMEEQMNSDESWAEEIRKMKEREDMICLLPDNAGDKELEDF